jgi:hypothetical protein
MARQNAHTARCLDCGGGHDEHPTTWDSRGSAELYARVHETVVGSRVVIEPAEEAR